MDRDPGGCSGASSTELVIDEPRDRGLDGNEPHKVGTASNEYVAVKLASLGNSASNLMHMSVYPFLLIHSQEIFIPPPSS